MRKFQKTIEDKYKVKFNNYWEFHKWSVEHLTEFWSEIWDYSGLVYSKKFEKIVDVDAKLSDLPVWFEGAKLNFAENVLKFRDDRVALIVSG
ncbi:hypothetical protein JTE90_016425 [Oedothorax gibbosus]|uniref:Acetyl-coenzyme A synthetase N-terminal domain-containing protein n=1 Tax=Oedothorax gibbosus TaxID=931172 RepID=A0AAV6TWE0_9ARAC|nr:hypothetical protein JTE90_016425 [Oedothorax gibbosus]